MHQTAPGSKLYMRPEGDDWIRLRGTKKSFVNLLRKMVRPSSYLYYDAEKSAWLVYWKNIPIVVEAAKRYFPVVDWSALPDRLQMYAAGGKIPEDNPLPEAGGSPYDVLFVTEHAPNSVIKAAYQALSLQHHPDRGGDEEKMADLAVAYAAIRGARNLDS
jgi:hypothetical protein